MQALDFRARQSFGETQAYAVGKTDFSIHLRPFRDCAPSSCKIFPFFPREVTQSLTAVLAGLQIPFPCSETHELGEELVASYLYQVHLYHWLVTHGYGRFLVR